MGLESKLNKRFKYLRTRKIESFKWGGEPLIAAREERKGRNVYSIKVVHRIDMRKVNKAIAEASIVECLSSPSEYIREYKKWLLDPNVSPEDKRYSLP